MPLLVLDRLSNASLAHEVEPKVSNKIAEWLAVRSFHDRGDEPAGRLADCKEPSLAGARGRTLAAAGLDLVLQEGVVLRVA
jgi:hypothetical protein